VSDLMNVLKVRVIFATLIVVISGLTACAKPGDRSSTPIAPSASAGPSKAIGQNAKTGGANLDRDAIVQSKMMSIEAAEDVLVSDASVAGEAATSLQRSASQAAAKVSEGAASNIAPGVAPGVVLDVPVAAVSAVDDAKKRDFVLAAIEPSMRLNAAIFRERFEIERIRAKVTAQKDSLNLSEIDWLARTKSRYQLGGSDSFDDLLARVDVVYLPILIAPLALVTGWNNPQTDLRKLFSDRMETLNTSSSDENVRFRAARALRTRSNAFESVVQMKAFLGMGSDARGEDDATMVVVSDIIRISQDAAIHARIQQVAQLLRSEVQN
jgi:hypothetical protein